jgi:hypothetical protein
MRRRKFALAAMLEWSCLYLGYYRERYDTVRKILHSLPETPRWDFVSLFLSDKERASVYLFYHSVNVLLSKPGGEVLRDIAVKTTPTEEAAKEILTRWGESL